MVRLVKIVMEMDRSLLHMHEHKHGVLSKSTYRREKARMQ
jgi:hypothetical protein